MTSLNNDCRLMFLFSAGKHLSQHDAFNDESIPMVLSCAAIMRSFTAPSVILHACYYD